MIRGFKTGGGAAGSFVNLDGNTKYVDCDSSAPQSSITHSNGNSKGSSMTFKWKPDPNCKQPCKFHFKYTVVEDYSNYHAGTETGLFSVE